MALISEKLILIKLLPTLDICLIREKSRGQFIPIEIVKSLYGQIESLYGFDLVHDNSEETVNQTASYIKDSINL